MFRELSRYVKGSRGMVLVYNHISEVAAILDYKRKVHFGMMGVWFYRFISDIEKEVDILTDNKS